MQTGEIRFDPAFSVLCEQNACGFFGACWMCPPDVGNISDWIAKARSYDQAIVFQTVREIEDSFDIEGMNRAARVHNRLIVRLRHAAERDGVDCLLLGAGACVAAAAFARGRKMSRAHIQIARWCRWKRRALMSRSLQRFPGFRTSTAKTR
ncbi:MAG: DUF2284 domain-containing protein [Eubacteriales bacterium]